jgi:hypothetical protein
MQEPLSRRDGKVVLASAELNVRHLFDAGRADADPSTSTSPRHANNHQSAISSRERETYKMQAIIVNEFGGPEAFTPVELERPSPGPSQVLVKLKVSGVNFLDAYQRNGATPLQAPFIAGVEGVGAIVAAGEDVSDLKVGQRIGWFSGGCPYAFRQAAWAGFSS